jgi:hypothetical protein
MNLKWVADQIARSQPGRNSLALLVPRYNPRPAGVLQEGGAAKAVLLLLQAQPDRLFTFSQIVQHTQRTPKSLDWACIFLRSLGYVECSKDDSRNPKYLRYKYARSPK